MKRGLPIALLMIALGCGTLEDELEPSSTHETRVQVNGKADAQNQQADTGSSLADEFDYCGTFELYGDGTCHTFCWESDPDCDGIEDEPSWEPDYDDEEEGCQEENCTEEPAEPVLTDEEVVSICGNFNNIEPATPRDLAESLCIEREYSEHEFERCIGICLSAYANRQTD